MMILKLLSTFFALVVSADSKTPLYIGILGSKTGPDSGFSLPFLATSTLAVWVINNQSIIFPNHTLIPVLQDDMSSDGNNFFCMLDFAGISAGSEFVPQKVSLVVGPDYSSRAQVAADPANRFEIPLISPTATAPILSTYPFFSRVVPSDAFQGAVLAFFVQSHGWRKVGTIFATDTYSSALANAFMSSCVNLGVLVSISQSFDVPLMDASHQVKLMKASEAVIFLVSCHSSDIPVLFNELNKQGMIGLPYIYLFPDAVDMGDPSVSSLLQGCVQTAPAWRSDIPAYTAYMDYWRQVAAANRSFLYDVPDSALTTYTSTGYDAMFVAATALAGSMDIERMCGEGTYPFPANCNMSSGELLQATIKNVSYSGATGLIEFDKQTGERKNPNYGIFNNQAAGVKQVGWGTPTAIELDSPIIWPGGGTATPADSILVPPLSISVGVQALFFALEALLLIAAIVVAVVVVQRRRHRVMLNSSPPFLIVLIVGCVLLIIAAATSTAAPTVPLCTATAWMLSLGITFVMGSIGLKLYRLHRIFNQMQLSQVNLSDKRLFVILGGVVSVDVLLLGLITGVTPFELEPVSHQCTVRSKTVLYILVVVKVISVAWSAGLVFTTRAIPSSFNESLSATIAVYGVAICGALWGVFSSVLSSTASITLQVLFIIITVGTVLAASFLPKFRAFREPTQHSHNSWTKKSGTVAGPSSAALTFQELENLLLHCKKMATSQAANKERAMELLTMWTEQAWMVEEELRWMTKNGQMNCTVVPPLSEDAMTYLKGRKEEASDRA